MGECKRKHHHRDRISDPFSGGTSGLGLVQAVDLCTRSPVRQPTETLSLLSKQELSAMIGDVLSGLGTIPPVRCPPGGEVDFAAALDAAFEILAEMDRHESSESTARSMRRRCCESLPWFSAHARTHGTI